MKFLSLDRAARLRLFLLCGALLWTSALPLTALAQEPEQSEAAATSAPAQDNDSESPDEPRRTRATRPPAEPRFEIELQAPEPIQAFLLRHMELQRFRLQRSLDGNELGRLIAQAPANLRELLATLGYFTPEIEVVAPAGIDEAATQNGAPAPASLGTVQIRVEPGPITRVAGVSVSFVGDIATAPEAAEQRADIQRDAALIEGMPFSQADWDRTKSAALRRLIAQRYPAGRIRNSLADIDNSQRAANLYIELDSGQAMRIGNVVVQGAERYDAVTAERLVRLSGLTPGSDYDLDRLQDAQRRIAESGYYDSVFVYVEPSTDGQDLPVMVQLRESKRQKVVIGIGGSTDNGARISLEHTHHSVPGLGWRAHHKLQLERIDQIASSDWSSPPNDDGWRKIAGAQLARQLDDFTTTSSQRLRVGQTQSGIEYDRSFYLQYDRARVVNDLVRDPVAEAANSSISANYAWTRRRFDDLIFPQRGHGLAVELGVGYTLGGPRLPFGRTQARWLTYWPLGAVAQAADPEPGQARDVDTASRRTQFGRLALRLEGGAVVARADAPVPDTQLFITGGDNTVRGYGLRDIGVRRPDGSIGPGRYKAVVSLEWQRPIWNGTRRSNWENVLFIDGGAISDKAGDLRPRWGVGTGLRYNSPVGPLQIDLAYGLETRRLRLHLNVGFAF